MNFFLPVSKPLALALFIVMTGLCPWGVVHAQDAPIPKKTPGEEKDETPPPPEGGGALLEWVEGVNEVLDKPLWSDENMPGSLSESTRAAGVLIGEEQNRSLWPTVVEPLVTQPGFDFRRAGAADLIPVIRGLGLRRIALYLDGYRLDSPAAPPGLEYPLSAIDSFSVGRTEVIRGASPIFHGNGALGGVIHVMTTNPLPGANRNRFSGRAVGRVSTATSELSGSLQARMNFRNLLGASISTSARNLGPRRSPDSSDAPTDTHSDNFSAKVESHLGDRITLAATHHHMRQKDTPSATGPSSRRDAYRRWDIATLSLTTQRLSRALKYSRTTLTYSESSLKGARASEETLDLPCRKVGWKTLAADTTFESPLAPFLSLLYGAAFIDDSVETSDAGFPELPDGAVYQRPTFHLAARAKLWKRLKLLPGFRVESARVKADIRDETLGNPKLRYRKTAYGAALAGRFQLTKYNSLFGGYQWAYRFPTLSELIGTGRNDLRYHVPETDLEPERLRSVELGLRLHFPFVKGQLVAYQNWLDDMIELREADYDGVKRLEGATVYASKNTGPGRIRGIEGKLETYLGINWNFGLNFSAQSGVGEAGEAMEGQSPFMGTSHLRWTSDTGAIAIDVATRFAAPQSRLGPGDAEMPSVKHGELPGYQTLDLRLETTVARYVHIMLGVLNLTGEEVYHLGSQIPEAKTDFITQLSMDFN